MPTARAETLEKKTMQFREGDWDFLTDYYQPKGVTTSRLIRELISKHVDTLRALEAATPLPKMEP
ncbi:MAG TPA: hypothetical protein VK181_07140 [Rhizobium sp.]|nr:hypothetical protein [Rhizobium sp.]